MQATSTDTAMRFRETCATLCTMEEPSRAVVYFHLGSMVPALCIGALVFARTKGTTTHRWLGRVWVGLMGLSCMASFGLRFRGHFSWLHALAALTLFALSRGVYGARTHNHRLHKRNMVLAYAGSLVAFVFAFQRSRLLGRWFWGLWS